MTITFEDGDVKNVPLGLIVHLEEAEKAKEYAAAVVQVRIFMYCVLCIEHYVCLFVIVMCDVIVNANVIDVVDASREYIPTLAARRLAN